MNAVCLILSLLFTREYLFFRYDISILFFFSFLKDRMDYAGVAARAARA